MNAGRRSQDQNQTVESPIDVWNVETFDVELIAELYANAELVRDYIAVELEIATEREAWPRPQHRANPHRGRYDRFFDDIHQRMKRRTIRAWHYTRLTDSEVDALLTTGIHLSTKDTARQRLNAQVAAGLISVETADAIFKASPYQDRGQAESRSNRFWMTSHPMEVEDDGVTLLLDNWGGEAVYFWLEDAHLQEVVAGIGKARVVEVAVPLDAISRYQVHSACKSIIATFARGLGCIPDFRAFDLSAICSLGPEAVLAVHTEGEANFVQLGKRYPEAFSWER